jgi:hypothetical protein
LADFIFLNQGLCFWALAFRRICLSELRNININILQSDCFLCIFEETSLLICWSTICLHNVSLLFWFQWQIWSFGGWKNKAKITFMLSIPICPSLIFVMLVSFSKLHGYKLLASVCIWKFGVDHWCMNIFEWWRCICDSG